VTVPLQTGLKVIDALIPIGRGQRELILGDRQTGKSAIALDTILNQQGQDVRCVYCAIGQRSSATAKLIADLKAYGAMDYCLVVVAGGDVPPGMQFIAPYAATTMAEYFMEQGQDVLIVYDDLTAHARAYRELSLLLRRPPGREAYPGDIFYIHARLLERSTHLSKALGGGSLTALPILETEAQNISAYIPTNLISITDGQIYLSPTLFQKGVLPAVDVGKSVSRVGGKTQLPAFREVAGPLRLAYTQFEATLKQGRRVRQVLKQDQYAPWSVPEQIAVLLAVTSGCLQDLPLAQMSAAEQAIQQAVRNQLPAVCDRIQSGDPLSDRDRDSLLTVIRQTVRRLPGPDVPPSPP
jgi:F-type H+-transporting ATPase subunit alpha